MNGAATTTSSAPSEGKGRDQADRREADVRTRGGATGRVSRGPCADVLACGVGTRREGLADDILAGAPLHPELGLEDEPVRQRRHRHRLDVVRGDEVAPCERGAAAGELQESETAAWAGPDRDARALAGRRDESNDVVADRGSTCTSSTAACIASSVGDRSPARAWIVSLAPLEPARQHLPLGPRVRIAEPGAQRNRSSCASGSGYVPSYSIGFWVARTRNGRSRGR